MSKLLSEEQIERLFQNHLSDKVGSGTRKDFYDANKALEASARTAFKHAFILLMPIIEKQDEIIKELLEAAEVHLDDTMEKIQETKQMLEKQLGKYE